MGLIAFLKRRTYGWRIRHYVDELEEQIDDIPEDYWRERAKFDRAFKRHANARISYILMGAVFYGSIITSVTAEVGLKLNIFQQIFQGLAGILGASSILALFFLTRYFATIEKVGLENARARIISYLTHIQREQIE